MKEYIIELRDWRHEVLFRGGVYAVNEHDAMSVAWNILRVCEWRYSCDPKYIQVNVREKEEPVLLSR